MKKHISVLQVALMLALCLLPFASLAAPQAAVPDQLFGGSLIEAQAQVGSIAWAEDTLFILTSRHLYAWQEGQAAPKALSGVAFTSVPLKNTADISLHAVVAHAGQALGLDANHGVLYHVTAMDGSVHMEQRLTLDWSPFQQGDEQHSYVEQPAFVTVAHGRLYVRVNNYDNKPADLFSYDLETGAMKQHAITLLQGIVPYKEGKLLAVRFDQNKMDPETMQQMPPELLVVNPEDDTFETPPLKLPAPSTHRWGGDIPLWYDPAEDAVYALAGGQMLRLTEEAPQAVALLQDDGSWSRYGQAVLPYRDDLVFVRTKNNVLIRSKDPRKMGEVTELTINQRWLDERALALTMIELGNVRLVPYDGPWMDNQALATHLLTAEKPLDLLVLTTNTHDPQQMMKKGYLVDLSGSETLRAYADDALEAFQRVIRDDTGLYALPVDIQTHTVSANRALFEQLGRPLPRSIPELMDLVRWWGEEGHQLEDTALLDANHAKRVLQELAFLAYANSMMGRGETLSFDMDTFGAMMQEIDQLDVSAWDLPPTYGSGDDDDLYIPNILLTPYVSYQLDGYHAKDEAHLLFSPDGAQPGYIGAYGQVIALSAKGTQQEAALRFLEAYVRNLPDIRRAAVSQSWSTPIENPRYQQEYEDQQAYLAQCKARYEAAPEGASKRQFAEEVAYFEQQLATFEQDHKYLVDEALLKDYQEFMAHVYVDDSLTQLAQQALSTDGYLFHMYQEGAITLEQFIQQANDKIRLMVMEAR